jgi:hypothetical protein
MLQHYTICPVDLEATKDFYVNARVSLPQFGDYGRQEKCRVNLAGCDADRAFDRLRLS